MFQVLVTLLVLGEALSEGDNYHVVRGPVSSTVPLNTKIVTPEEYDSQPQQPAQPQPQFPYVSPQQEYQPDVPYDPMQEIQYQLQQVPQEAYHPYENSIMVDRQSRTFADFDQMFGPVMHMMLDAPDTVMNSAILPVVNFVAGIKLAVVGKAIALMALTGLGLFIANAIFINTVPRSLTSAFRSVTDIAGRSLDNITDTFKDLLATPGEDAEADERRQRALNNLSNMVDTAMDVYSKMNQ